MARVTVFLKTPADYRQFPLSGWWERIAGQQPSNYSIDKESMQALAEGSYRDGKLLLVGKSERVDWHFISSQKEDVPQTIGPWPNSIDEFASAVGSIMKEVDSVNRIALGAILVVNVMNRDEGYRLVEHAVRDDLGLKIPADGSDFQVQLNRPVPSRVLKAMTLNRLCQWSVQFIRPMQLRVRMTREGNPEAHAIGGEAKYALRAALDFNTSPEWTDELKPGDRVSLLEELTRNAREFVESRIEGSDA